MEVKDRATRFDVAFGFDVGSTEKHHVEFKWGQWKAQAWIFVDGNQVFYKRLIVGIRYTIRYQIEVGASESHKVVIERHRRKTYSGLRKQSFRAFVDDELVGEF
jgi:hypothetical protein